MGEYREKNRMQKTAFNKKMQEWTTQAKKEGKPICTACARRDWLLTGRTFKDDIEQYRIKTEPKVEHKMINEYGRAGAPPAKYIMFDYRCPLKHGVSMQYSQAEWEATSAYKNQGKESLKKTIKPLEKTNKSIKRI